ncbi:MAG TPA: Nif3-like dinuclear metal center hexameric protein [Firmicutes bacterium]|nr:Nif3-like dinuclear metal center hexameric protein [Bacillota bacterium]
MIEKFAPPASALPGDASGLQWGDSRYEVPTALLSLDFSAEVLEEALEKGASFIFTHHPFIYRPLKTINLQNPRENLIARALCEGITLYCAHTNLDVVSGGVSDVLAKLLGLKDTSILSPTGGDELEKLVTFVPGGFIDDVRDAICHAGAGWIGNYSHCTYQLSGTGTFLPREGAKPFIGEKGTLEKVDEFRLETVIHKKNRDKIVRALLAAHPYEEVAYDLYPLNIDGQVWGLGRVGRLAKGLSLHEFAQYCHRLLAPDHLKVLGDLGTVVEKVAVLGGSGGDLVDKAMESKVDVFLTGDLKFHQAQEAELGGLSLIDAGHEATEWPVIPAMAAYLQEEIEHGNFQTEILISEKRKKMWHVFV